MTLDPMPETEIRKVLKLSSSPNFVLLTSGQLIYAQSLTSIDETGMFDKSRKKLDYDEYLVIEYMGIGYEYYVAIPYSDIADLILVSFSQAQRQSTTPPSDPYNPPVAKSLYERSLEIARESDYPIHDITVLYDLNSPSDFSWGEVNFSDDTPLYCDWDYLERRSGGVTSLGGGALGFSLSAGWDESLWSAFKDVVESSQAKLHEIGNHNEVVTSGHVDFVTHDGEHISREMDGKEWIAGIVSNQPVEDISELEDVAWAIGFFKRDSVMLPLDVWEYIANPVTIFGEVVDSPIETGFGSVDYFLKARASAFLEGQV